MSDVAEHDKTVRIENSEVQALAENLESVAAAVKDLVAAVKSLEERPLKRRLVDDLRVMTVNLKAVSGRLANAASRSRLDRRVG
jgi:hypothetical protein